ncbi:MAG: TVP38/TMEM64 family protein [Gemmataceae bacterium]
MPDPVKPSHSWLGPLLGLAIVIVVVSVYYSLLRDTLSWESLRWHLDYWKSLVDDHLLLAVLCFFLVYVLVTAFSLPAAGLLSLLAGALFGRWLGLGIVSTAATLGATLAFLTSRYLLRQWVQSRFAARLEQFNRGIQRDGLYYLFLLRLVPAVPFFLVNLVMGLTTMRVLPYALVSWAGMLLPGFLYVNAGTQLAALESAAGLLSWPVLLSLAAVGAVPLGLRFTMRWWRCRQQRSQR